MTNTYQIAIIGAGPGGYVAAIRSAQRGASVLLIEKDSVGGVCLNRGCIPTKTLIETARYYKFIQSAQNWGIKTGNISFDWEFILNRKNQIVLQLRKGIEYLLKKNKITLIHGAACVVSPHTIKVENHEDSTTFEVEKMILATGSEPVLPPLFPFDGIHVITSNEALNLQNLPQTLLIVGGGVIGCEIANLFSSFGVKVTLVEALPSLLSLTSFDPLIIRQLSNIMKKQGIAIRTGSPVQEIKVDKTTGYVQTILKTGEILTSEKVLVSIGRRSNISHLGLEEINIGLNNKGDVIVDETMQTNIPGIYAIGDITGKWQLAHAASFQGKVAAEHATSGDLLEMRENVVPCCIFTDPPASSVGLTETGAQERGVETVTGDFPYRGLGKAHTTGETEGLVRIIAEKSSARIIGAHILGSSAPELIHEFAMAIQYSLTVPDTAKIIHAHPTFSESIPEACEAIFGISIHK